jgi:hypothetical protein
LKDFIVVAVVVGAGALLLSGCRSSAQVDSLTPQRRVLPAASAASDAARARGTTSLPLGAVHVQRWGSVSALKVSEASQRPSDALVRVLVRTCFSTADAYNVFISPGSLGLMLSDGTRPSYLNHSRTPVGHPEPVYQAAFGPVRTGTCFTERIGFTMPKSSTPSLLTYVITGGDTATWRLAQQLGRAGVSLD